MRKTLQPIPILRVTFTLTMLCSLLWLLTGCGYASPGDVDKTYAHGVQTEGTAVTPSSIDACSLVNKDEVLQIFHAQSVEVKSARGRIFTSCLYDYQDATVTMHTNVVVITEDAEHTWYAVGNALGSEYHQLEGMGKMARYRESTLTQLDVLKKDFLLSVSVSISRISVEDTRKERLDAAMKMALLAVPRL